jgi:hypothetical protein
MREGRARGLLEGGRGGEEEKRSGGSGESGEGGEGKRYHCAFTVLPSVRHTEL